MPVGGTMAESELLLTLAEVAVAFAGFASLVGVLGERRSVDHALVLGARMRAMILTSLLVTGFSLLPPVVSWYGRSPRATWSISTVALFVAVAAYLTWLTMALRRSSFPFPPSSFQKFVVLPVLSVTSSALLALVAVNMVLRSPALYVTALALLLFQGGFAFLLVVFSFLPGAPERKQVKGVQRDEEHRDEG